MKRVRRLFALGRAQPATKLLIIPVVCGLSMTFLVALGGRFEREFRANLEQGFQQRVELGDLASSLQQLRRGLEFPRVLDNSYIGTLTERIQEVDQKVKAQNALGRMGDLSIPTKELTLIVGYKQGFERLAATAAQIERVQTLRTTLKPPEISESSALKRVSGLLEAYASASASLRGSRGGQQSIVELGSASLGLGENLQAALLESRRKAASQGWREVLAALPTEPADFIDRMLADARLLEDFQTQRARALGRLEQASAKIDSAERLLLGSKADRGLLVVSTLLTWLGLGFGLLGLLWLSLALRKRVLEDSSVGPSAQVDVLASQGEQTTIDVDDADRSSEHAERVLAERVAVAVGLNTKSLPTITADNLVETVENDEVTSGYWIASGSMAERRVALLDKQSVQLELHVKSVLAAAESLAGRADLVVQSLQLVREDQSRSGLSTDTDLMRKQIDELQSIAINLSLQVASGAIHDPVLDDLEQFNRELESLALQVKAFATHPADATLDRRVNLTLDEGRRMIAAADTLKERTETLYEDAQRFRRHSEALIKGIQDGAISEVPMRLVKDLRNLE